MQLVHNEELSYGLGNIGGKRQFTDIVFAIGNLRGQLCFNLLLLEVRFFPPYFGFPRLANCFLLLEIQSRFLQLALLHLELVPLTHALPPLFCVNGRSF